MTSLSRRGLATCPAEGLATSACNGQNGRVQAHCFTWSLNLYCGSGAPPAGGNEGGTLHHLHQFTLLLPDQNLGRMGILVDMACLRTQCHRANDLCSSGSNNSAGQHSQCKPCQSFTTDTLRKHNKLGHASPDAAQNMYAEGDQLKSARLLPVIPSQTLQKASQI